MNICMYSMHNATSVYIHSCVKCSVLVLCCVQSGMSVSAMVCPKDIFLIPVMRTSMNVIFNKRESCLLTA